MTTKDDDFGDFPDAPSATSSGASSSDEFADFADEQPKNKASSAKADTPENTWWGAVKGDADAAATLASGAVVGRTAALARTFNRALPTFGPETDWNPFSEKAKKVTKEDIDKAEHDFTYEPKTPEGRDLLSNVGSAVKPVAKLAHDATASVVGEENVPAVSDAFAASSFPTVSATISAPIKAAGAAWKKAVAAGKAADAAPTMSAEENLASQYGQSAGNMGAAEAAPSLEGTSKEFQDAVANSKNVNKDALTRHIEAETLPQPEGSTPLRLRKGQATGDTQQLSDEKNLRADPDTAGILSDSITDQDAKLGASMGEIRRRATPEIVQRSNAEHGQANIDAIKTQDNAAVTNMRAAYKDLSDANGGTIPMDTSSALSGIREGLNKGFLNKTARDNPVVSEVLEQLESGRPMTFEEFENARSNLADVQRQGGSSAKAAAIVRGQLESMPLSEKAAPLKALADKARALAKQRFDTIEQNPAYEAAVNDNVPKGPGGLHNVGAPSPLADTFMDRYYLGNGESASRAYVARIKKLMEGNEDFAPSIEAASLNKLRDAAGLDAFDSGSFRNATYRNARNAMEKKADVLMSPKSADWTDQLKRVSGYVNDEGKASSVNRSNTALTLQRFGAQYPETPRLAGTLADYATDVGAAHLGPVGYAAKKIGSAIVKGRRDRAAIEATRNAKLKFAQDATAPGAGLDLPDAPPRTGRATGGKVDHEALVNRLITRWKSAKKETDKTTEPLLNMPDSAIVKALNIAQEHI